MKRKPWHTLGFLKLASAFAYLIRQQYAGNITREHLEEIIPLLRDCGKLIRQEYQ